LAVGLFTALNCTAQWEKLAALVTTGDGHQLYITAGGNVNSRVFRIDGTRVDAFWRNPADIFFNPTDSVTSVTGDGRIVAVRQAYVSFTGGANPTGELSTTWLRSDSETLSTEPGRAAISFDGRYLLLLNGRPAGTPVLRDRTLQIDTPTPLMNYIVSRQPVSSNGIVIGYLLQQNSTIGVWDSANGLRTIPSPTPSISQLGISDSGNIALSIGDEKLFRIDLSTSRIAQIAYGVLSATLSNDGQRIVYVGDAGGQRQVFLFDASNGTTSQLTDSPFGIRDAVIAGFGQVAWATTGRNEVLKIDLERRATKVVAVSTVFSSRRLYPGSLSEFVGGPFIDSAVSADHPLPLELAGIRMTIGGLPARIHSVQPNRIIAQVPRELEATSQPVPVEVDLGPRFVPNVLDWIRTAAYVEPRGSIELLSAGFLSGVGGDPLVLHENFQVPVNVLAPARPRDIVHFYAIANLAVDGAVADGAAPPAVSPIRASPPPACALFDGNKMFDIDWVYAGLAPGYAGVYQLSIRLPERLESPTLRFACGRGATFPVAP
jgi:uncharacterized protein (TIGR03437 family)